MIEEKKESPYNKVLIDFVRTLILPMLFNKAFMLYFGLKYAEFPGEGYGYGLATTIFVLVFLLGKFLWKYKDVEDP